jgi:hypothetical protein
MPRTTRASTRAAAAAEVDADHDPAFAALPAALRARIDAAFDRAAAAVDAAVHEPPRKRRRTEKEGGSPAVLARDYVDDGVMAGGFVRDDAPGGFLPADSGGGGFLPSNSGGGFILEDDAGGFIPAGSRGFIAEGSGGGFIAEDSGGGFLLEDPPSGGGGFIPDDDSASEAGSITSAPAPSASALPLSRVPGALVRLGLPPDDPDVLRVLANAAAGWGADADPGAEREKAVPRRDWRAVCAVLMDGAGDDEGGGDESGESDAYVGSDADADEGEAMDVDASGDEDEYGPRVRRTRTKGKGKARADDSDDDDTDGGALSAHQAAEVRRAFGLFFAAAGDDANGTDGRRLGVREIDAAARVLKEQITAEDVRVRLRARRGRLTRCRSWRCSTCFRRARTRRWACPSLSG